MTDYQPRCDRSRALIIGINDYADPRFVPLSQAEADAVELSDLLATDLFGFEVTLLLGQQAGRRAILDVLLASYTDPRQFIIDHRPLHVGQVAL